MANKSFSFRLPAELVKAIESRAKATGQSKTRIVTEALAKVYGHDNDLSPSELLESFQQLQQQLEKLDHLIGLILSNPKPQAFRLTNSEQQTLSRLPKRRQQLEIAEEN